MSELEAKVALYEGGSSTIQTSQIDAGPSEPREGLDSAVQLGIVESPSQQNPVPEYIDQDVTDVDFDVDGPGPSPADNSTTRNFSLSHAPPEPREHIDASPTRQSSPDSELMNPLALGVTTFAPNARSIPSQYRVARLAESYC